MAPKKAYKKKPLSSFRKMVKKDQIPDKIKNYVKRTLDHRIENKTQQFYVSGNLLRNITNDISTWRTSNIFYLSPSATDVLITQGVGQGNRIGNKITIKKAVVRGILYPNDEGDEKPLEVNAYICNMKMANTISEVRTVIENQFFQDGNNELPLTGTLPDYILQPNNDVLTMHKRMCYKLGVAQNGTNVNFINNDFKYNQKFNIDVTKYLKKTYTFNDTVGDPIDPYVCLIFSPTPADNILNGEGAQTCYLDLCIQIDYEDA